MITPRLHRGGLRQVKIQRDTNRVRLLVYILRMVMDPQGQE